MALPDSPGAFSNISPRTCIDSGPSSDRIAASGAPAQTCMYRIVVERLRLSFPKTGTRAPNASVAAESGRPTRSLHPRSAGRRLAA